MNDKTSHLFFDLFGVMNCSYFFELHILSNSSIVYEITSEQFDLIILSDDTPEDIIP